MLLFVGEPLIVHRWMRQRALTAPDSTFLLLHWLHWILLALSVTVFADIGRQLWNVPSAVTAPLVPDEEFCRGRF